VIVAASSKDKNYTYIPDCSDLDIPDDTDYVYICENETIHGVTWHKLPNTKGHVPGVRPVLHVPLQVPATSPTTA
jgi:phosphoserine aminotransferase